MASVVGWLMPVLTDERSRHYPGRLRGLARRMPSPAAYDRSGMRSTRPEPSGSRGRSASVIALLVVAAVAFVGLVIVRPWSDDDAASPPTSETTTTEPAPVTPEPPEEHHLPTLSDPMPLEPRVEAAVVWTGTELVVWGGIARLGPTDQLVAVRNDGAALDPATGTWRVLPEWPFADMPDQMPMDIVKPEAVATDAGVVVIDAGATAIWDLDEDSWRVMDPGPIRVGTLVAHGSDVFSAATNTRLDVTTGQWHSLPEPPVALLDTVSAWTGDELVVAGFVRHLGPAAQAFDPASDSWRTLPDLPPGFSTLGSGSALGGGWDGDRVLLVNGSSSQVLAYDPTAEAWEELPSILPRRLQFWEVPVGRAGDQSMVFLSEAMTILDGDLWRTVPYGWVEGDSIIDFPRLDAVRGPGSSTVLIPVVDPATDQLVVLSMDVLAALEQREIPLGPITVTLPDRWSVSRILQSHELVRRSVDLQLGDESCTVIAGGEDESFVLQSIGPEVTVDHDGDERVWERHPSGSNWHYDGGEFVVVISCGDPDNSEAFARGVRFDDAG
jgi:hypothetical protein